MDVLKQSKLSKSEWETIEVPITEKEKRIVLLISDGYNNTSLVKNYSKNMIHFTKLSCSDEMQYYIYTKYFQSIVNSMIKTHDLVFNSLNGKQIKKLKSADAIRVQNVDHTIKDNVDNIFEFDCLQLCKQILKNIQKKSLLCKDLYTIIYWKRASIDNNNPYVMGFVNYVIDLATRTVSIKDIIYKAPSIIEQNNDLYKYEDLHLFPHQKEIFSYCRLNRNDPKLILYTAPTGTGKTLTPIGLANDYKIVFVCVARHIGMALAKSAISVDKKVAFAFGCETASDIRLHYFAAVDYEKNKRSGGIGRVDNSNGSSVEIMICDVQSYKIAMYYMQSFNSAENLLMYWDEPTMTLDYENHELHNTIHDLWENNTIPNIVLSCATLPNESEIQDCIQDFRMTFMNASVHTITSYDCKKSIPIINKKGECFMPHIYCDTLNKLQQYARYCNENKTLLRYFDLQETVRFIECLHETLDEQDNHHMDIYFENINDITMNSLKLYYLVLLSNLSEGEWNRMYSKLNMMVHSKFNSDDTAKPLTRIQSLPNVDTNNNFVHLTRVQSESHVAKLKTTIDDVLSGVLLTTKDAHTLTDGPTIYIADNLLNLAKFYVQQSKIPEFILKQLIESIQRNNNISETIKTMEEELEKKLQVKDNTDTESENASNKMKTKKTVREKSGLDENTQILKDNIDQMKKQLSHLSLHSQYIPNSIEHQMKWKPKKEVVSNAFTPNVDEATVKEIMSLNIHKHYKLLVLMGIGVLINHENKKYEEIVKQLAQEQKLFLIIASSDFIYGTNYQFCHGFIGKDLPNMTWQKILQTMGRIGRNSSQQNYSVRFRDDNMIHKLFQGASSDNREALNMNSLLCHD